MRRQARLRAELSAAAKPAELETISEYILSLKPEQRELLTATMSADAKEAATELVKYVLSGGVQTGQQLEAESDVCLEKRVLEQICRWQLILGYRLRELEAKGDAQKKLGA